jgi:hypothetical protein
LWSEILKGRKHFGGLVTNGRIILMWNIKKEYEEVDFSSGSE